MAQDRRLGGQASRQLADDIKGTPPEPELDDAGGEADDDVVLLLGSSARTSSFISRYNSGDNLTLYLRFTTRRAERDWISIGLNLR